MKKLIVFDVDGTLWNPVFGLSDATTEAVQQLSRCGHHLCVCTGRTSNSIPLSIQQLPICSWITSDGACIESPLVHKTVSIPPDSVRRIAEVSLQSGWGISLECPDCIYMNQTASDTYTAMNRAKKADMKLERIIYENNFSRWSPKIPVYKICLMLPENAANSCAFEDFDVLKLPDGVIELHPPGINKGAALACLQNHLGYTPEDTICLGDGKNDLAMTDHCSCFIAMKESTEEVKKHADHICPSAMDTGISEILKQIGLLPDQISEIYSLTSMCAKGETERKRTSWNLQ